MSADRERFWHAWGEGTLLLETCVSCRLQRLYHSPLCPRCGSPEQRLEPSAGTGEIHSFTVVGHRAAPDRVVVLVTLVEDVRVLGTYDGAEPRIGQGVRIAPDGQAAGPIRFAPLEERR